MREGRWKTWKAAAYLIVLSAGAFGLLRIVFRTHHECELCERPIHPPTAFRAVVDGREVWTCCARCGLSTCAGGGRVEEASATDYPTGRKVPAQSCVYVEGSDLTPCCSPEAIVDRDKITCGKCFDRCYPSVIAFSLPGEAIKFMQAHGGKLVGFETVLKELKGQ